MAPIATTTIPLTTRYVAPANSSTAESQYRGIYGFKFVSGLSSPDHRAYHHHPLMVRGNPVLCMGMARKKIQTSLDSKELSEDHEVISRPIHTEFHTFKKTPVGSEQTLVSPIASLEEEDTNSGGHSQDHHHDDLLDFAIYANAYLEEILTCKLLFGKQPSESLDARIEPSMISKFVSQTDRNLHLNPHSNCLEKQRHSGGHRLASHSEEETLPAIHRNHHQSRIDPIAGTLACLMV